jgi:hypothetical protein
MIAYAKHPLSKADRLMLRKDGYKIIDLRFKPETLGEGDKIFPEVKRKKKKSK